MLFEFSPSEKDAKPAGEGSEYAAPMAIAQVEPEFFEAAAEFYHRVTPSHNAVDASAIGHMVCDVEGMTKRKIECVTTHGEDAAVAMRHGREAAGKVGGVVAHTDIGNHIDTRHYGQLTLKQQGSVENGFVKFLPRCSVGPAHRQKVFAQPPLASECLYTGNGYGVVEPGVVGLPLVENPSPRSPAPDAEVGGEEIVVGADVGGLFVDVEAGNHTDAFVVGIALEHFCTKGDERVGDDVVVFEYNDTVGQ